VGGKFHPKLNTGERPIAYKYREGKMQRTLKRELKVLEIVKRETIATSSRDPSWVLSPERVVRLGGAWRVAGVDWGLG